MLRKFALLTYSLTILISLTACGGGGGSSSPPNNTPTYTKATAKIAISGTLPAGAKISGTGVTVTLPVGVTVPTDSGGTVIAGTVTPSGIFASGTQTPPLYTAASGGNAATLKLGLASGTPTGENQTGEIVTIVFNLTNGAIPISSSFALSDLVVVNTTNYGEITGLNASVSSISLQ